MNSSGGNRQQRRAAEKAARRSAGRDRRRRRVAIATGAAMVAGSGVVATAPMASAATYTVLNANDAGAGSLRQALLDADGDDHAVITFASSATGTITLLSSLPTIDASVDVQGPGAGTLTVNGDGNGAFSFYTPYGAPALTVSISDLTISGAYASRGAAIYAYNADLTLSGTVISDNATANSGGGVSSEGSIGSLVIEDSTITGNDSGGAGGGVYAEFSVSIDGSTISDNTATAYGGGVYSNDSLSISDSTVSGNTANGRGGGLVSDDEMVIDDGTLIELNESGDEGGGVHAGDDLTVEDSTISTNTTSGEGGGILADANATITDSTVSGNTSGEDGGGVSASGDLTVEDGTVIELNESGYDGGGLTVDGALTVTDSTITGNEALYTGGGLEITNGATIERSTIADNSVTYVDGKGGGIAGGGGELITITESTVSGNEAGTADGIGGGIWLQLNTDLDVVNSTVSGNGASSGGGIWARSADLSFVSSTITANDAGASGGMYLRGTGTFPFSVTLESSILAGNTDDDIVQVDSGDNSAIAASYSLIGDEGAIEDDGGHNLFGVDPELGELADNDGPTFTHLPDDDSPVVDAGGPSALDTDQRGEAREQGDASDIGSVETAPPPPPTTTTTTTAPATTTTSTTSTTRPPSTPSTTAPTTSTTVPIVTPGGGTIEPERHVAGLEGEPVVVQPSSDLEEGETETVAIAVTTDAGTVSLVIDQRAGDVATSVTVTQVDTADLGASTAGFTLLGVAFEVEVTGGAKDGEHAGGTVCFPYDPDDLEAAGLDESDLVLFHFKDDGTREVVTTTVDTTNHRVCGHVDSFSPFAVGDLDTDRFAGSNAARTAAAISAATFEPGVPVVHVVTRGPDGLGAGAAAAFAGGPVLLVDRDQAPFVTRAEIERLNPRRVVVVGGADVITDAVVEQLGATRVAGADRYETAAALSAATFASADVVYIASGRSSADAVIASAAAAANDAPLLLVGHDTIPASTAAELARLRPARVVVVGGTAAVSDAVTAALGAERLAGPDRYATSAAVARALGRATVFVTRGDDPTDAAAAVPAAAAAGAAMLLVEPDAIPDVVRDALARLAPRSIAVLGGTAAVSMMTELDLTAYLPTD